MFNFKKSKPKTSSSATKPLPPVNDTGYPAPKKVLEPLARLILLAVYDDSCILSKLRGTRFLVKAIWEYASSFDGDQSWSPYIKTGFVYANMAWPYLHFPQPQDLNINMMPFIMSEDFAKSKLPKNLEGYWEFIQFCLLRDRTQMNTICFLTVHESFVKKGCTQRRPGLHIECPGQLTIDLNDGLPIHVKKGNGDNIVEESKLSRMFHQWGLGIYDEETGRGPHNGIFMGSSVNNSCVLWNCKIVADEDGREVIGHLGDMEHLRKALPNKQKHVMRGHQLYWLTDRTPHESLPMKDDGYRQYFRLVTNPVSVWYEQHNTANPNGVKPDPKITKIVKANKFAK